MLLNLGDWYFPGSLALLFFLGLTIVRHINSKREQREEIALQEQLRKDELQRLIETRGERGLLERYPEDEFWSLIERATQRAKPGYTFQLGVLRDLLSAKSPDDLLRLDNLYHHLIEEYITHDVTAAAAIIFKDGSIPTASLLMNLFMMQGEVFFKNACQNPSLVVGKRIEHIEGRGIDDLLADLYYRKTNHFIPLFPESNAPLEITGEPWKERDLPSRYPELWNAFA